MKLLPGVTAGATISADEVYRYALTRDFVPDLNLRRRHVLWVMLNPSTATAEVDDATIRRCQVFARDWGYDGITVGNLFALRARNPERLKAHPDPEGPDNDMVLLSMLQKVDRYPLVVAGWGARGTLNGRDRDFEKLVKLARRELHCLGTTSAGQPRHPLYLKATAVPEPWTAP